MARLKYLAPVLFIALAIAALPLAGPALAKDMTQDHLNKNLTFVEKRVAKIKADLEAIPAGQRIHINASNDQMADVKRAVVSAKASKAGGHGSAWREVKWLWFKLERTYQDAMTTAAERSGDKAAAKKFKAENRTFAEAATYEATHGRRLAMVRDQVGNFRNQATTRAAGPPDGWDGILGKFDTAYQTAQARFNRLVNTTPSNWTSVKGELDQAMAGLEKAYNAARDALK